MATKAVVKDNEVMIPEVEKTVVIRIPRDRNESEDKVVWVNEKRWLIQRGVNVEVPMSVAKQIEHEEEMLQYIYEYEERVSR